MHINPIGDINLHTFQMTMLQLLLFQLGYILFVVDLIEMQLPRAFLHSKHTYGKTYERMSLVDLIDPLAKIETLMCYVLSSLFN